MKRVLIFLLSLILISLLFLYKKKDPNIAIIKIVGVEIKGAVKYPGFYELKEDSNVNDLINRSGGLLDNSDISIINLSKRLDNEMVVIIYTKEEINEMKKGSTSIKYIEKECYCPILENDGCFDDVITNNDSIVDTGKISLNTGTIVELMTLPGVGETRAKDIIKYRDEHKGFKRIDEIKEVKGIGDATFEKIKNYLTL